jgi:hypothetical protein
MSKTSDLFQNTDKVVGVRDEAAPSALIVTIATPDGTILATITAGAKEFSTGSVGFFAGEKMTNPKSGKRYQVGMNVTLIGSKPA